MAPVVVAEGVSKRYRIGPSKAGSRTLADEFGRLAGRLRGATTAAPPATEFWALRDVSFAINPGDVVGIVGRNGAGKSTLLKLLSRITRPTAGTIRMRGRVGSLLEVGTGFHPELTGRENVYLNGAILGMSRAEIARRFDDIVSFAEVEKFLDTPVKRYSSGMYTRLAFAVAAHLDPDVLIVDEVLAVGDAAFQQKCLGKMDEAGRSGRTVLFVSHSPAAVYRLTDRCILLAGGRVAADGPTREVLPLYTGADVAMTVCGVYQAPGRPAGNRLLRAAVYTSGPDFVHDHGRPIAFEFDVQIETPSDSWCFTMNLMNDGLMPVCVYSSLNPGAGWGTRPGVYRLRCELPSLRLFMGDYRLSTWLANPRLHVPPEHVGECCSFRVRMPDPRLHYDWRKGECVHIDSHHWSSGAAE